MSSPHTLSLPATFCSPNADLRKLSNVDAAAILLKYGPKYGITAEEVAAVTDRWADSRAASHTTWLLARSWLVFTCLFTVQFPSMLQ